MNEKTKTWLTAALVAAVLAFAALIHYTHPALFTYVGIDDRDLGGGALAGVIAWLALRGRKPLSQRVRLALGVGIGAALLLGFAVYFIS